MTDLAIPPASTRESLATRLLDRAVSTFLAGRSPHTQRAYRARLDKFLAWRGEQPAAPLLEHLRAYIGYLSAPATAGGAGLAPRSVQVHVHTVKGLIRTAAALEPSLAIVLPSLDLAKPPAVRGGLQGNRLTAGQRQQLLDAPGVDTCRGRRDTAILALLAVCGLRRSEVAELSWRHLTELDGHKVIRNLRGKQGRVRTVKLPPALWRLIWSWAAAGDLDTSPDAPVFVAVRQGDKVQHGQRLTNSAVAWLVTKYTRELGLDGISPHDLRRTAASLSRKGGASIEQVQHLLGHASPQTTSQYIGESLNLDQHGVDYGEYRIPT